MNNSPKSFILNSGGNFIIRSVNAEDRNGLLHLFDTLSSQSRYFRFAHAMSSLPEPVLDHLLHLDSNSPEIALVAVISELPANSVHLKDIPPTLSHPIVGIARCVGQKNENRCEFSLSVSDAFHGEGVGSELMLSLLKHAHAKGCKEIYGYVLVNNENMLELMDHLGFSISTIANDPSFKLVTHLS